MEPVVSYSALGALVASSMIVSGLVVLACVACEIRDAIKRRCAR